MDRAGHRANSSTVSWEEREETWGEEESREERRGGEERRRTGRRGEQGGESRREERSGESCYGRSSDMRCG